MKISIGLALAATLLPAAASAQDWSKAKRIDVDMANFNYTPNRLVLRHGEPYVLHFINSASGGHDFTAKAFFSAARVAPSDVSMVVGGKVALAAHGTADVRLVAPAAGSIFEFHCSHFMHDTFGMKGEIAVQ